MNTSYPGVLYIIYRSGSERDAEGDGLIRQGESWCSSVSPTYCHVYFTRFRKVHGFNFTSRWKYVNNDTIKIVNSPTIILKIFKNVFKSAMLTVHCTAVLTNLRLRFTKTTLFINFEIITDAMSGTRH